MKREKVATKTIQKLSGPSIFHSTAEGIMLIKREPDFSTKHVTAKARVVKEGKATQPIREYSGPSIYQCVAKGIAIKRPGSNTKPNA